MSDDVLVQCPVCQNADPKKIEIAGERFLRCAVCGTADASHRFQPATAGFDPTMIFPPQHVFEAMETLHLYFTVERRSKQWAYGHVQSRDTPALIGIEHIRNMAAAFQMVLVPRLTDTRREQIAIAAYNAFFGGDEPFTPWDDLDAEDRDDFRDTYNKLIAVLGVE